MPGLLVHIASATPEIFNSLLALKGAIAPDYWKNHPPTYEEYVEFFKGCDGAPSYEQILLLCDPCHGGSHFGSKPSDTNHADFALIDSLFKSGQLDARNIFFKGYIHHLRTDTDFYGNPDICNHAAFNADFIKDEPATRARLHRDWDRTNHIISARYPQAAKALKSLPPQIMKYIKYEIGPTKYISLSRTLDFINEMRKERTLQELLEG